jgi:hypothetical protein
MKIQIQFDTFFYNLKSIKAMKVTFGYVARLFMNSLWTKICTKLLYRSLKDRYSEPESGGGE